jgi:uncharacterized protein (TIGR02145 family)
MIGKVHFFSLIIGLSFLSCNLDRVEDAGPFVCGQTITDPRDGKTYKTIWIAEDGSHDMNQPGKCWMAQNLNFNTSNFFSSCYQEIDSRCDTFGRLYSMQALPTACLNGWHIATPDEWKELYRTYGWTEVITGNGPLFSGDSTTFLPGGISRLDYLMGGECDGPADCLGLGETVGFWTSESQINSFFHISGSASVFSIQFQSDWRYYIRCIQD